MKIPALMTTGFTTIALVTLGLMSCVSTTDRFPSSAKDRTEVAFALFSNEGLLKKEYTFELIDLNQIQQKKIKFSRFDSGEVDSQKALNDWISQLRSLAPTLQNDIEFTSNKLPVRVKVSDFKRLDKALDLLSKSNESQVGVYKKQIAVISAFNQNFKDPLDLKVEILTAPFELLARLSPYPVKERRKENDDVKVENSSFWSDRSQEKINMALGPSDLDLSKFQNTVCSYDGPKRGFGIHQGLKAKCFDKKKFKVKFGEIRAAPLNSKIYHRLGYNVPAIHSIKDIKIAYERKMFTEIESGKQQYVRVKALGIPVKSVKLRKKTDFEKFISHIVLKGGEKIDADTFFKNLLPNCGAEDQNCHLNAELYDSQYEQKVDHVVFHNIAIVEETSDHEFGAWAFDELDHKYRTEVRALVLVGAFTGNHDLRKDNNKLLWQSKNFEIKHYITDPGSGYGRAVPFSSFNLNDMKWEIMKEQVSRQPIGPGKTTIERRSLVINGYKPSVDHDVFSKLNLSEAKWIARQILSISEDELTVAIAASGFSAAELLLTREKLVSMQKNIAETLDLLNEYPQLAERKINRGISYQPTGKDLELVLSNGEKVSVEEKNFILSNGVLARN